MFYESFYNDCTTWIARVNYGTDDRLSVDAMAWWVLILQEGDFEPCQEELEILETLRVRGVRP